MYDLRRRVSSSSLDKSYKGEGLQTFSRKKLFPNISRNNVSIWLVSFKRL